MADRQDNKRVLNELLPAPTRATTGADRPGPRARTAEHLQRILAAALALQISSEVGAAQPPAQRPAPKPVEPPKGYQVVDPVPPPPRDIPRPPAAATGALTLRSIPRAIVFVDGKATGKKTPLRALPLAAGTHTIRLVTPGRKQEQEFTVTIKPNQTLTETRDLRRTPPAPKK